MDMGVQVCRCAGVHIYLHPCSRYGKRIYTVDLLNESTFYECAIRSQFISSSIYGSAMVSSDVKCIGNF